ncbi:MAG: M14 family zinc carboxypeptidase [Flavobacteriaceae bacterium]
MQIKEFNYSKIKAPGIDERYLTQDQIDQITSGLSDSWKQNTLGYSVENRPVYSWTWGQGPQKLLMWSQMHGNESTTTRGLLDFMRLLDQDTEWTRQIKSLCTLCVIPVLNPDGAYAYTRSNAASVDLNRDAQLVSQPESKLLRSLYDDWSPSFCFNLHDQRTIYNVGNYQVPATMSFLAPAADEQLSVPDHRAKAMQVIVDINEWLQSYIPHGVGRYDDAYNINCVGDTFQTLGTPTILFEAGHYADDYQRTNTRALVCLSLYTAINSICFELFVYHDVDQYLAIPQNEKKFVDVLIKNPYRLNSMWKPGQALAITLEEKLIGGSVSWVPTTPEVVEESAFWGLKTYDVLLAQEHLLLQTKTDIWSVIQKSFN